MSVCIMQTLAGALPREVELGDPEPTPVAKPARK
jgi:hypothetical protein